MRISAVIWLNLKNGLQFQLFSFIQRRRREPYSTRLQKRTKYVKTDTEIQRARSDQSVDKRLIDKFQIVDLLLELVDDFLEKSRSLDNGITAVRGRGKNFIL